MNWTIKRFLKMFQSYFNRHEIGKHELVIAKFGEVNEERDPLGYYFCRCGCAFVFSTQATRNRFVKYPDFKYLFRHKD
jgi:hypothetical protein